MLGGGAEPLRGAGVIGLARSPFGNQHGQVVHRLDVPAFSGALIPRTGFFQITLDADAFLENRAEEILRGREFLLRRALKPCGGLRQIAGDSATLCIAHCDFELRGRGAARRCVAQILRLGGNLLLAINAGDRRWIDVLIARGRL